LIFGDADVIEGCWSGPVILLYRSTVLITGRRLGFIHDLEQLPGTSFGTQPNFASLALHLDVLGLARVGLDRVETLSFSAACRCSRGAYGRRGAAPGQPQYSTLQNTLASLGGAGGIPAPPRNALSMAGVWR